MKAQRLTRHGRTARRILDTRDTTNTCAMMPGRSAPPGPGLLTWSEIWRDVENSKSLRSSRDRRIVPGHRVKGASALHNYLASIFTAPSVTAWGDMSGITRKNQVTKLVTLRHQSIMSGALGQAWY
jgi:hypothetical protein